MRVIPYGRQDINEADIEAVVACLKSDWLTQGPAVGVFEQEIADYCQAKYAVACCNATAALHLACLALELGSGDFIWTSPITFVASANCGRYCGAQVDFVDIDPSTLNISLDALQAKLAVAEAEGKLPKIVVAVHFAGQSCDMQKLHELSQLYGFHIIEDASHAIGGFYRDQKVGSCQYSDITVFSFHPVKVITTGEGGIATTNKPDLHQRLELLRSHGITREMTLMQHPREEQWYYEQTLLGHNYRMTDIQAALGQSQLKRLNEFVDKRRALVERYNAALDGDKFVLPSSASYNCPAWHLYVVQLKTEALSHSRDHVFKAMRNSGIGVNLHYIPVHLQPYYRQFGFGVGDFPHAEAYYSVAMTLPLYPQLTHEEQDYVIKTLTENLQ